MFFKVYLTTFIVFLVLDLLWLGIIARKFYNRHLGFIMSDKVNWTAAVIFYIIFVSGIVVFVVLPALQKNSWDYAAIYGALFGLVTYSAYDLTNLATLEKWPLKITLVDLLWGTFLASSVSLITFIILN